MPREDFIVRKEILLAAPPARVWEALTNPELTEQYFFGCEVQSDWKPGSDIRFKRRILWLKFELKGKIVRIEPEKLLQYTLVNSSADNPEDAANRSLVTEELREQNGQTLLTVTDDVGDTDGAKKRFKRSSKGWDKILRGLKKLVEEEPAA
jgi:uncharacterized protein YndB with AHSA1/START domain